MSRADMESPVLQCVAVSCNVLQYGIAQHDKTCPNVPLPRRVLIGNLLCVAVCCSVLQCVAVCCSVLQCDAVCCSVLK